MKRRIMLVLLLSASVAVSRPAVRESSRGIPLAYDVDVVVVGGSTRGASAAAAAKEFGASVFLMARRPCLGADMCATYRLWLEDGESPTKPLAQAVYGDGTPTPLHVKRVLDDALRDAGVDFLYGCYPTDVLRDSRGQLAGVVMANHSGRQAVRAKVIVDATEVLFQVPPDPVKSCKPQRGAWRGVGEVDLDALRPDGFGGLYVLGGRADVAREVAGQLMRPVHGIEIEAAVGRAAAGVARHRQIGLTSNLSVGGEPGGRNVGEIGEMLDGLRSKPGLTETPVVKSPTRAVPVLGKYDVVVVGGGTAGAPAGIAAARAGANGSYGLAPVCAAPFGDNAVLQQKTKLPVWGASLPGATVTVSFNGQTKVTRADGNGAWRVELDPMDAPTLKSVNDAPTGKTMTIVCENDGKRAVKELKNLLVGDVWVCAGQSNMAGRIKTDRTRHWPTNTLELATYPALRRLARNGEPWTVCSPETASDFGKVSFFFARRLQKDALVPVGLIRRAVGGSAIESWLNRKPYETGKYYTRFIEPIVGFGIKGAIWYQGESNERDRRGYQPKLEALIKGWREVWGMGVFPFYYVQLPGIGQSPTDNPAMGDGRAEIRQAYVEALALPNAGLAVTIDIGTRGEHPPNKYDTGDRLARAVLRNVYGFRKVGVSPLYKSHKVEGRTIRVSFSYGESGLMLAQKNGPLDFRIPTPTPGAKLGWLSIQDEDGTWHWADGTIGGSELIVSCDAVTKPQAVRYAYTTHPTGPLLYSRDGMPVSPFSTIGYGPELPSEN